MGPAHLISDYVEYGHILDKEVSRQQNFTKHEIKQWWSFCVLVADFSLSQERLELEQVRVPSNLPSIMWTVLKYECLLRENAALEVDPSLLLLPSPWNFVNLIKSVSLYYLPPLCFHYLININALPFPPISFQFSSLQEGRFNNWQMVYHTWGGLLRESPTPVLPGHV